MALLRTNSSGHARQVDGQGVGLRQKWLAQTLVGFSKSHPCMGARAAAGSDGLFLSVLGDMSSVASAFFFLQDLEDYFSISDDLDPKKKSLAVAFLEEPIETQDEFALKYWCFAQTLHDIDCLRFPWDGQVSNDVNSPDFELSLCGRAIFTTTLNPQNPRFARKFGFPVWVINQHTQFNHLREIGRFSSWQKSIREADAKIDPSGESNPILVDHGYGSAAKQLAGSEVAETNFTVNQNAELIEKARQKLLSSASSEGCPEDLLTAISLMKR